MKKEWKRFLLLLAIFLTAYFLPIRNENVQKAILNAFEMLQWYAVNHTLGCVVPAIFIAGAISTFLSKETVLRCLGPNSNPVVSYGMASVSGILLAVCSCSVLPMFAGIYRIGAGLGPACAFLCSGPALNVMAIFLSARVLGLEMGVGRTVLAVTMSVLVGFFMAFIFRKSEKERVSRTMLLPEPMEGTRKRRAWQTGLFLASMVLFLIFSDWVSSENYPWSVIIFRNRGWICLSILAALLVMVWRWFDREEVTEWLEQTWSFAKTIVPLLFGGVFATGFLTSLLPQEMVANYVGGNSASANLISSSLGMLWYFSTLSEIPMLEALRSLGMGDGPAMTLLLAGPTLSLPSLIVLGRFMDWKKTLIFAALIMLFAASGGWIFGKIF